MRINLTFAGFGGGSSAAAAPPPPPAAAPAPPAAPTAATAARPSRAMAGGGQATPANVRNSGGARGISTMGSVSRALKSLTGQ